jgi:excinuclease ABC subunit C
MQRKAEELKFEEAEVLKKQYLLLDSFCAKSEIVSHTITDVDVFSIVNDETNKTAFINYIHVKNEPSTRVLRMNTSGSSMNRTRNC